MAAVAEIKVSALRKLDAGLDMVNNWGATSATNDASNTTYATAGAVKSAYDLASGKLDKLGNAASATKWANGVTITLAGDATGSVSFDGATAALTLNVAVGDDSHNHAFANLTGKPTTLAGYGITDAVNSTTGNAPTATKLATARPFTIGLATSKNFDGSGATAMTWSLADIGAYAAAGGGIAGDFWRSGSGTNQFGLVDHLGWHTDAKPCLVLLAKKYIGAALDKTGFVGRILFNRGGAASANITDFVDVAVASAYTGNTTRLLRSSGPTVVTAKIVEVTYNSVVYYALWRASSSSSEVVVTGHAFDAALPLLIADATSYTVTDVVTMDEDYHAGNKPTPSDVGLSLVDNAKQMRTATDANGYYGLVDGAGSAASYVRTTSNGLLPYTSGGASTLGTSAWPFNTAYVKTYYENGVSLAAKYLALAGGTLTGSLTIDPATVGATQIILKGDANATGANARGIVGYNSGATAVQWGAGLYTTDTTSIFSYIGFGAAPWDTGIRIYSVTDIRAGSTNRIYHEGYKPTPAAIGAAPSAHVGGSGEAHANVTTTVDGFMSAADKVKLNGIATGANAYTHPTGDGNLHVPANGTGNSGKALVATATAGSVAWTTLTAAHISDLNSQATAATANTLALRDASADISARLFRSNYADQTSITGAMAFRVNNSSDNYIRYCSDEAAIRAYLGVLALAGGTVTGQVTFTSAPAGTGNTAHIFHNGNGTGGTAINIRSMREAASATWVWEQVVGGRLEYSTGTTGSGASTIVLNVGTGVVTAADVTVTSDRRLKSNFAPLVSALDKLKTLTGQTYDKANRREVGLIAQEVQEVLPEAVHTDDNGYLSLSAAGLVALLVEAVKELDAKLEGLLHAQAA